jgi:hypothetical protein
MDLTHNVTWLVTHARPGKHNDAKEILFPEVPPGGGSRHGGPGRSDPGFRAFGPPERIRGRSCPDIFSEPATILHSLATMSILTQPKSSARCDSPGDSRVASLSDSGYKRSMAGQSQGGKAQARLFQRLVFT